LLGAGILCLVDQNVVETAVELVQHPVGGTRCGEQRHGALDQVVEIEGARGAFGIRVVLQCVTGKAIERAGCLDQRQSLQLNCQRRESGLSLFRRCQEVGASLSQALAHQLFARLFARLAKLTHEVLGETIGACLGGSRLGRL